MKIKRKVEMNLPQLIEWGFKNDVINKEYVCNEHKAKSVIFNLMGWAEFSDEFSYNPHDTFTIEVEEVVDSDTVLDNIYTVDVEVGTSHTTYYKSKSINDVKTDEINIIYTILQEEAIVLWDSQEGFR